MTPRTPIATLCIGLAAAAPAAAEEWAIYGSRAMGMGGAGVAAARGGAATYWNPAALALRGGFPGLGVNGGGSVNLVAAAMGDTMSDLDRLHDDVSDLNIASVEAKFATGTPLTETEVQLALAILARDLPALNSSDDGFLVHGIAGASMQIHGFGVAALASFNGAAHPELDLSTLSLGNQGMDAVIGAGNDRSGQISGAGQTLADQLAATGNVTQDQAEELVFQAEQGGVNTADAAAQDVLLNVVNATAANDGGSLADSFTNNNSGGRVAGVFVQEVALGYGRRFLFDWLAIGASAKLLHAFTYSASYRLQDSPESSDIIKDTYQLHDVDDSLNMGFDAGAIITPTPWLAIGVTGKNLNSPTFRLEGGGHVELDPLARAGVALYPLPFLTLAADIDLYHYQSDLLPGHVSQVLGGGAELDFGMLALQAGLSKNLLNDEDVLLHAGVEFSMWYFHLQAAAMLTPNFEGLKSGDGTEVPDRAGLSLSLGFNIPW